MVTGGKDLFWNSVGLGGLMVIFWIFELIPIYVTALFPFVLAVPLGVLDKEQLAASYGSSNVFLFFGGFVLALALEKWDVHKRVAHGILHIVGTSKTRILLGFLLSTCLLSMWISNTATALMMLPMATAITSNLRSEKKSRFPLFLLLSVAYAASIGGMATLVGSPPNTQMASILTDTYGIEVDFFQWMKVGLPLSIVMLLVVFGFFYFLLGKERKTKIEDVALEKKKWDKDQIRVVSIFLLIVILWSFRKPLIDLTGLNYRDEGAAVLGAILLFFIPSTKKKPLLEWKDTKHLPWGILLLFGGGLALAQMFESNGVIQSLSTVFEQFKGVPLIVILTILVTIAIFATEIMSNLALVTVFIPVIAQFAMQTDYSVLQLCMPVALAASCAFMLPVGTPPNAIVFSSGELTINQMAKTGFVLNLVGIIIVVMFSVLFM